MTRPTVRQVRQVRAISLRAMCAMRALRDMRAMPTHDNGPSTGDGPLIQKPPTGLEPVT